MSGLWNLHPDRIAQLRAAAVLSSRKLECGELREVGGGDLVWRLEAPSFLW